MNPDADIDMYDRCVVEYNTACRNVCNKGQYIDSISGLLPSQPAPTPNSIVSPLELF